jgi:hypothetical protein
MAPESRCFAHAREQLVASLLETLGLDYRCVEEACYLKSCSEPNFTRHRGLSGSGEIHPRRRCNLLCQNRKIAKSFHLKSIKFIVQIGIKH